MFRFSALCSDFSKKKSYRRAFDPVIVNRCSMAWKCSRTGAVMTWSAGEKQSLQEVKEVANTSKTRIQIWQLTFMSARGNLLRFFVFFILGLFTLERTSWLWAVRSSVWRQSCVLILRVNPLISKVVYSLAQGFPKAILRSFVDKCFVPLTIACE